MLQIQVLPGKPVVLEGVSRKSGQPFRIVQQAAYVIFPDGTAASFTVQPPRDGGPFPPGSYTIGPDSFYVRDGDLAFSPKLVPVAADGSRK